MWYLIQVLFQHFVPRKDKNKQSIHTQRRLLRLLGTVIVYICLANYCFICVNRTKNELSAKYQ